MRNKLITLALSGLLAVGASATLFAQDATPPPQQGQGQWGGGRGRGMDPEKQLEHLAKQLNLSSEQQSQIRPILQERQQKMQALFQNQSLSREERHTQMQAIHQDTESRITSVLNDDQKQKYQAMQEHMREHGGPMQGGDNGPPSAGAPQPQ
jgi:periplasmic protein CpxP/Spy